MKGHESVGSVAEEAAKLFAALQADHPAEHSTTQGPAVCQWCPVCQLVGRIRQCSPETIEQLTSAAFGVLTSLRSFVDAATEAARQAAESPQPEEKKQERVDVSEDPERWD